MFSRTLLYIDLTHVLKNKFLKSVYSRRKINLSKVPNSSFSDNLSLSDSNSPSIHKKAIESPQYLCRCKTAQR